MPLYRQPCQFVFFVVLAFGLPAALSVKFVVGNKCPFALTLNGASLDGPLSPANVKLQPGQSYTYSNVPSLWRSGRLIGAPDPNNPNWAGLAEMSLENGQINYDISYVDSLVVPASIIGGASSCQTVGCVSPFSAVMGGCPRGKDYDLRHSSGVGCLSACTFCSTPANAHTSFCTRLTGQIQKCASQAPYSANCHQAAQDTTINAYCCSSYFDGQPAAGHTNGNMYCAALNRGNLAEANTWDETTWFKLTDSSGPLYNEYASHIHNVCPGMYSFAYDDFHNTGSHFSSCATDTLYITWCPGDQPAAKATKLSSQYAKINFQPDSVAIPEGFVADTGTPFSLQNGLSYGWQTPASSFLIGNSTNASDVLHSTFAQLRSEGIDNTWKLILDPGYYDVLIVAGHPASPVCMDISVNGVSSIKGCTTSAQSSLRFFQTLEIANSALVLSNTPGLLTTNPLKYLEVRNASGTVIRSQVTPSPSHKNPYDHLFLSALAHLVGEPEDRFVLLSVDGPTRGMTSFHVFIRNLTVDNAGTVLPYQESSNGVAERILSAQHQDWQRVGFTGIISSEILSDGSVPASYAVHDTEESSLKVFWIAAGVTVALAIVFIALLVAGIAFLFPRIRRAKRESSSSQATLASTERLT